jgi:hypothetical protein
LQARFSSDRAILNSSATPPEWKVNSRVAGATVLNVYNESARLLKLLVLPAFKGVLKHPSFETNCLFFEQLKKYFIAGTFS